MDQEAAVEDGTACIVCRHSFTPEGSPQTPTGWSETGTQVFRHVTCEVGTDA